MNRRRFLTGTAITGLTALAGCLGSAGDTGPTDGGGDGGGEMHPALGNVDVQPVLGSADQEALIVAYEDPSCSTCRRFEQNTLPELKAKHIDTGNVAFAFRVYPIIYPWGKPAVQALEATYARDEDAFWSLKDHYYADQPSFSEANVLEKTEQFLAAETDLDAAAVAQDARDKAYDDAVQLDLDSGKAAGASATPTFYLFLDGELQTSVQGAQDVRVFENALQL
ncbi:thioredoxin domain-containing protein [Haladaptatus sp. DJG-WS-42]|uniref:DsbA family protein n=1 Tax=Haladaptatus sp. DJG-WS-42 TaxID=3120516 RepID=UPI0030D28732